MRSRKTRVISKLLQTRSYQILKKTSELPIPPSNVDTRFACHLRVLQMYEIIQERRIIIRKPSCVWIPYHSPSMSSLNSQISFGSFSIKFLRPIIRVSPSLLFFFTFAPNVFCFFIFLCLFSILIIIVLFSSKLKCDFHFVVINFV